MGKTVKKKAQNIFLILLVLMFVGYLLVTGIGDLVNQKDLYTIHADQGVEIMEVEHSINGLIPIGSEHYYFLLDTATGRACIVNGSEGWYKRNFNAEGLALDAGGVNLTSLAKKTDYDVAREIVARISEIQVAEYAPPADKYLKLNYKMIALEKLLVLVLSAVIAFVGYRFSKSETEISLVSKRLFLVAVILYLIFFLRVLTG